MLPFAFFSNLRHQTKAKTAVSYWEILSILFYEIFRLHWFVCWSWYDIL